ncbi:hypothetical protein [Sorangium sp. So ce1000]
MPSIEATLMIDPPLQAGWSRERLDELLPAAWARASLAAPAAGDAGAS